jgi:hypothetical protein
MRTTKMQQVMVFVRIFGMCSVLTFPLTSQELLTTLPNNNHYEHFQESPLTINPDIVHNIMHNIEGYGLKWNKHVQTWSDTFATVSQTLTIIGDYNLLEEILRRDMGNGLVNHAQIQVFYKIENWNKRNAYPDSTVFFAWDPIEKNWKVEKQIKYIWDSINGFSEVSQRAVRLYQNTNYDTIDNYFSEDWQVKYRYQLYYNPTEKQFDTLNRMLTIIPWNAPKISSVRAAYVQDTLINDLYEDINFFDNGTGYVRYHTSVTYDTASNDWLLHYFNRKLYTVDSIKKETILNYDTVIGYHYPTYKLKKYYDQNWTLMRLDKEVFSLSDPNVYPDTTWRKDYGYDSDGFLEHITISKRNGFFNDFVPLYKWYFTEKTSIGVEPSQQMPLTLSKLSNSAYRIQHPQLEFISAHYQLLNVQGQILSSFSSGQPNVDFELSPFSSGIYFIVVTTPTQRTTFKLSR